VMLSQSAALRIRQAGTQPRAKWYGMGNESVELHRVAAWRMGK
jgi:hypothetical protein